LAELDMTTKEPKSARVLLSEDHRRIEQRAQRFRAAIQADDREASNKAWMRLERAVLAHFDVEEMFVFPPLRKAFPAEVDRLLDEHSVLRAKLGEIGMALELHTARCEPIETFCQALREHADREDSLAYAEAARRLPASAVRSIASRIGAALSSLVGGSPVMREQASQR
jgi:hypothetical protein